MSGGESARTTLGRESGKTTLDRWRAGDQEAAGQLYARFAQRLWWLARRQIGERLQRRVDPDDILQSVFRTFFRRTAQGEYPVADTGSIWFLLVRITLRKVSKAVEREQMQKRDPNHEAYEEEGRLASRNPTPDDAAALLDELEFLTARFDERDREIIGLFLDGRPNAEIASRAGLSEATIRRVVDRFKYLLENRLKEDAE